LLVDALRRSLMNEIVAAAVVIDAKDDAARAFYEYHNFVSLAGQPLRWFLPMTLIARQFSSVRVDVQNTESLLKCQFICK